MKSKCLEWNRAGPCQEQLTESGPRSEPPLLVGLAPAGPQDQLGAVGGTSAAGVQAEAGQRVGDRAVGVDVPLLVRTAGAVPDRHLGAVGGAPAVGVQALRAVDHQLPAGGVGPGLAGSAVAVPQMGLRAVGGG